MWIMFYLLFTCSRSNLDNSLMGKYICKMLQDLKVPTKGVNYPVKKEQKNCEQTGKVVHTIPINLTQYLPPSQQFTTA